MNVGKRDIFANENVPLQVIVDTIKHDSKAVSKNGKTVTMDTVECEYFSPSKVGLPTNDCFYGNQGVDKGKKKFESEFSVLGDIPCDGGTTTKDNLQGGVNNKKNNKKKNKKGKTKNSEINEEMKEFFHDLEYESSGDTEYVQGNDFNKGVRFFGNEEKERHPKVPLVINVNCILEY